MALIFFTVVDIFHRDSLLEKSHNSLLKIYKLLLSFKNTINYKFSYTNELFM